MSEAKEKMELKDKILLATPDIGAMQPHKLDGGECKANLDAIRRLRMERLVTAAEDSRGGFVKFELTDLGKIRKAELVRLQNRSIWQRFADWCLSVVNNKWVFALLAWIFGIISALIIAYLSKRLGWI